MPADLLKHRGAAIHKEVAVTDGYLVSNAFANIREWTVVTQNPDSDAIIFVTSRSFHLLFEPIFVVKNSTPINDTRQVSSPLSGNNAEGAA
jgi:hypothetical protein